MNSHALRRVLPANKTVSVVIKNLHCQEEIKIVSMFLCLFSSVRGVSWSLLTTVPERKLRRFWDMNFLWTAEKGIWKGWKRSDRKEKQRR